VFKRGTDTPPETRQLVVELAMMANEVFAEDVAYDFAASTLSERVSARSRSLAKAYRHVTPPPPQFLFFQRKVGGSFLICRSLKARVNCRRLLVERGVVDVARGSPVALA
jgi:hypothetical protein